MKFGIRTKLFLISFGLIVLTVVIGYGYIRAELDHILTQNIHTDLTIRSRMVALQAASDPHPLSDTRFWDGLADELGRRAGARVTLIRTDGAVIGDSQVPLVDLPAVENHAARPELIDAVKRGFGTAKRHSNTVDSDMLYVAAPFHHGREMVGIARLALPLTSVEQGLAQLRRTVTAATVLALGIALILSTLAAHLASRTARSLTQTAKKMAAGDLSARTRMQGADEFGDLGRALDQVARNLSLTVEELRSERDRLGGILAGMQEGVLMLDAQGKVAVVNPALREMLLLGPEAEGKTPLEVIRHAELKELLDEAREDQSHTVTREIELSGLKPRRLLVRASPLSNEQGIFAVFVDVTEVRKLESMRRDFVANVSHELRTPVTAIRSAAETLKTVGAEDPAAATMFVDIIDRNAERLHGLVEDLLDLSRIESRAFKLKFEAVEVPTLYSHIASLFADRAQKRGVQLRVETPAGLAAVQADRRALEHVLTNLLDNAVKYAGASAEVRLGAAEENGAIRLWVSDNGPGIGAKHLPRLFERFYRVDAGRSRDVGGTGLGLSIVKHLVEAMGSGISVSSEPGKGTRFQFTLSKWRGEGPHLTETSTLH